MKALLILIMLAFAPTHLHCIRVQWLDPVPTMQPNGEVVWINHPTTRLTCWRTKGKS